MIIFATIVFPAGPLILVFFHFKSDTSLDHALSAWRLILILSPLTALFFGIRGVLPGTKAPMSTSTSNISSSRILSGIALAILTMVAFGAWLAFRPAARYPNVTVTFLGYTNAITDSHRELARIAITNLDPSAIRIYAPLVESSDSTNPPPPENWSGYAYPPAGLARWEESLGSRESAMLTFTAPTNQLPWKMGFYVYRDRGAAETLVAYAVGSSCLSIGIVPWHYARMPYNVGSDWITSTK